MAKKKRRRPKKSLKRGAKGSIQKTYLLKAITGLGVLILLVVVAGVLTHHLVFKRYTVKKYTVKSNTVKRNSVKRNSVKRNRALPMKKNRVVKTPRFEIYPKNEIPHHKPIPKTKPAVPVELPKIAIIIDDIGYDKNIAQKFLDLDVVLTFSILPHSPHDKRIAGMAHSKGLEVMLHLPMEPNEYPSVNPGPGVLLATMSPDQLINQLNEDLEAVPFVKGVNNHMGSKMTTIAPQLYQIFSILKKRKLYFIDSRTTVDTICRPSAHLLKVPFAQKDVFIDHISTPDFVREQIHRLIKIAGSHGEAIGIGHPHTATYEVLREMLPELKEKTILVRASDIVNIAD
ncbi:MAG: divergent polysaccharide deacetylase family protein [Deltaproteobacteria bacterium]|nr:divergent polysaccharide deacetylase family protein [Deltaproteobacteria bacterium]